jgi:hypothetical protein
VTLHRISARQIKDHAGLFAAGIVPVIRMAGYSDVALMPEAAPQD